MSVCFPLLLWDSVLVLFCFSFFSSRRPLLSQPRLCHRCGGPELVHHSGVGADRSAARHVDGPLHVLVQPLLRLHLSVRYGSHGEDDLHPHPRQELLLRGESRTFTFDLGWEKISIH